MWPFSTLMRDTAMSADQEQRSAIDFSAFSDYFDAVSAGVSVSQTSAVKLPAVYKCVSLNAETISSLPMDVYAKRGDRRVPYSEPVWFREPNAYQTMPEFVAMTQTSLDLDGNAFWLKIVDPVGRLSGLTVLPPTAVQVELKDNRLLYWVNGTDVFAANEVVHLRGLVPPGELRGLSPIACAKQTIGIGLAAEEFAANFYGNGATMSGVVETPGGLTEEQAERLQAAMARRHGGVKNSHAVGVLTGGATWRQLSVKPDEAQFLESRKYTATEIANLYGVPPELVTDADGAKGYVTALHSRLRLWYLTGLLPRITRIERAFSDLLPRPAYIKMNTNALLRMDPEQQVAFFDAGQRGEWLMRNEIRAYLDMNPIPDGDEPLHSVQWQENAPPDGGDTEDDDEAATSGLSVGGGQ